MHTAQLWLLEVHDKSEKQGQNGLPRIIADQNPKPQTASLHLLVLDELSSFLQDCLLNLIVRLSLLTFFGP